MKLKQLLSIGLLFSNLVLFAQNDIYQSDKLKKVWDTKGLNVPESVMPVYDKGILYVSNVGSNNPAAKEKNGFISVLNVDGSIKNLEWCSDLDSPKGMGLYNGFLYVTEVDKISKIDTKTGEKVKSFPVNGATFLNDIAVNKDGILYITDSGTGTVYKLENDTVSVLIKSDEFPSPNGIIEVNGKLYVGTGDKVIAIVPETLQVEDYLLNTGGVDGLVMAEPDVFLFSNWAGKIFLMKKGGEKELLLDTSSTKNSKTADFGYITKLKRIYVPTFFGNSVVCYEVKY